MKWRIGFSALGLISLGYLAQKYGVAQLRSDLWQVGLWVIPLFLAYIPAVALYSLAWILVTPQIGIAHWFRFSQFTVIGVAWNNLSPFLKILGEPMKVSLLLSDLTKKNAMKSVILYNMIHVTGTALAILIVLLDFLFLRKLPEDLKHTIQISLVVVVFIFAGLLYFTKIKWAGTRGKRNTTFARKVRRVGISLRWSLMIMRIFSHQHQARFYGSVLCEVLARFIEGLIFYVAYLALHTPIDLHSAFTLDVGRTFIDNLTFFVPYQVGSREAGLALLTKNILHTGWEKVLAATMLYRVVELLWIVVGYLLWIIPKRSRKSSI